MGVDRTIDYRRDGWWKDLPPYDVVLDAIGGTSLRRSYDLLRPGGRLVAYGISSLATGREAFPAYRFAATAADAARVQPDQTALGVQGRHRPEHADAVGRPRHARAVDRSALERADGRLVSPVVHAAVPFDNAPEAHRILAARENVGKVVLVP